MEDLWIFANSIVKDSELVTLKENDITTILENLNEFVRIEKPEEIISCISNILDEV